MSNLCTEYAPAEEFGYGEWWYAHEEEVLLRNLPVFCDDPTSEITITVSGENGADLPIWLRYDGEKLYGTPVHSTPREQVIEIIATEVENPDIFRHLIIPILVDKIPFLIS